MWLPARACRFSILPRRRSSPLLADCMIRAFSEPLQRGRPYSIERFAPRSSSPCGREGAPPCRVNRRVFCAATDPPRRITSTAHPVQSNASVHASKWLFRPEPGHEFFEPRTLCRIPDGSGTSIQLQAPIQPLQTPVPSASLARWGWELGVGRIARRRSLYHAELWRGFAERAVEFRGARRYLGIA